MADDQHFQALLVRLVNGVEGEPDAEWMAAIALGQIDGADRKKHAVTALINVLSLGRAHALIRAHAVEALGNLGSRRAVPTLTSALHDSYGLVRAYAAKALGKLKDENAIRPLLESIHGDEFFGVRAEAANALASIVVHQAPPEKANLILQLKEACEAELARSEAGSSRVVAEIDRGVALLSAGG